MGLGAWSKRIGLSGLTWNGMKHHYGITPVIGFTIFAIGLAGSYVLRLATKHPEVAWTRKNPEPWQEYRNKQYKFVSTGRDYCVPSPVPKYK